MKIKVIKRIISEISHFVIGSVPFLPILLFMLVVTFLLLKKWELAATLFALFLTCLVIYHNDRTRGTQILADCYKEIKELEAQYYQKYEGKNEKEEMAWRSLFLNTLEFQSFLFNRDYLPRQEFLEFFEEVIKWGHNTILPKRPEDLENAEKFRELKSLYSSIKEKSRGKSDE